MGVSIDKISTFITYWLSVLLAFFGVQTAEKLALMTGSACAIFTALVNFWYRRKTWRYLVDRCDKKERP